MQADWTLQLPDCPSGIFIVRNTLLNLSLRVALFGSAGLGAIHAQDVPGSAQGAAATQNTDAKNLDSVVVTARSGVDARTKSETSYSITTIDEDRLRMQAPTSVTEAVKSATSMWCRSQELGWWY